MPISIPARSKYGNFDFIGPRIYGFVGKNRRIWFFIIRYGFGIGWKKKYCKNQK
jgi:hypothetical protein